MARKKKQSIQSAGLVSDPANLRLQRSIGVPLYQQVYDRLSEIISGGTFGAGARLPSSRSLANQLSLSRATVAYAYNLLSSDGYISGRGPAGTYVLNKHPEKHTTILPIAAVPGRSPDVCASEATANWPPSPLSVGHLPAELFPRKIWGALRKRQSARLGVADLGPGDPQGHLPLRRTLSNRLAISKGVHCTPDQVFMTAGVIGAMTLIGAALIARGDRVWVEDPGDRRIWTALRRAGASLVAVGVDAQGMILDGAQASGPTARLAVVTPCHQYPMGVTLSAPRRQALLAWSQVNDSWIVEHDLDSDFHFVGSPPPVLSSQSGADRVLYVMHLGHLLFPALGLSCVVVPPTLVQTFRHAAGSLPALSNTGDQAALVEFIRRGHIGRHITQTRELCQVRRHALLQALQQAPGGAMTVHAPDGGLSLLIALERQPSASVMRQLHSQRLQPVPLSAYSLSLALRPALAVGFATTPEQHVRENVAALAEILANGRAEPAAEAADN